MADGESSAAASMAVGSMADAQVSPRDWCRSLALDLPDAYSDFPFGPQAEALRIHGKLFGLLIRVPAISSANAIINLKADPEILPGLISANSLIHPGFHMNKRHWISLELAPELNREMAAALIEDSFDLVLMTLPIRLRPITHRLA